MGPLQLMVWASLALGVLVDLFSLFLLLRRPGPDGRRPSPVVGVPGVLYLVGASLAASTDVSFPGGLVAGLVLVHLGVVLGVPALLARQDPR